MPELDLGRYERMAQRARESAVARGEVTQAMLEERFGPAVWPWENPHVEEDRDSDHYGHRTHSHPSHGNGMVCSCGQPARGCFSFILDDAWEEAARQLCPVCVARGLC